MEDKKQAKPNANKRYEKRKEKSRNAARSRRKNESECYQNLVKLLPLEYKHLTNIDQGTGLCLVNKFIQLRTELPKHFSSFSENKDQEYMEEMKDLLEALNGLVIIVNSQQKILFTSNNSKCHLGVCQTDIIGQDLKSLVHEGDHDDLMKIFTGCQTNSEVKPSRIFCRIRTSFELGRGGRSKFKTGIGKYETFNCRITEIENTENTNEKSSMYGIFIQSIPNPNTSLEFPHSSFHTHHTLDFKFVNDVNTSLSEVIGYKTKDLTGKSLFDFCHPLDVETSFKDLSNLPKWRRVEFGPYRFMVKQGGWVRLVTQAARCDQNKISCTHYIQGSVENKGEITTEYQVEAEETKIEKEDEILVECKVETSNIQACNDELKRENVKMEPVVRGNSPNMIPSYVEEFKADEVLMKNHDPQLSSAAIPTTSDREHVPKLENVFDDDREHVPKIEKLESMFEEAPHQPRIEDFDFFPETTVQEGGGNEQFLYNAPCIGDLVYEPEKLQENKEFGFYAPCIEDDTFIPNNLVTEMQEVDNANYKLQATNKVMSKWGDEPFVCEEDCYIVGENLPMIGENPNEQLLYFHKDQGRKITDAVDSAYNSHNVSPLPSSDSSPGDAYVTSHSNDVMTSQYGGEVYGVTSDSCFNGMKDHASPVQTVNKLKRHAQTNQEVLSTSIEKQLPLKLARNISSSYNPSSGYNEKNVAGSYNEKNVAGSYNEDARNVASSYNEDVRVVSSAYNSTAYGEVYYQQDQVQYQLPFYSDDKKQQVPYPGVDPNNQNARNFQQRSSIFGNEIFLVKDKDYLCRQFNPPDIRNIRESAKYQRAKSAGPSQLCSTLQKSCIGDFGVARALPGGEILNNLLDPNAGMLPPISLGGSNTLPVISLDDCEANAPTSSNFVLAGSEAVHLLGES